MSTHYNALERNPTGKLYSVISAGRRPLRRKLGALPVVVSALLVLQSALPVAFRCCRLRSSPVVSASTTTGDDGTTQRHDTTGSTSTSTDDGTERQGETGLPQCYATHLRYEASLAPAGGQLEFEP